MGSGSGKPYRFLYTSPTELPAGQEGAEASGPPDSLPRTSRPPTPRLSLASKLAYSLPINSQEHSSTSSQNPDKDEPRQPALSVAPQSSRLLHSLGKQH
ncbi:unnamed protein product [Rangifer tarandus platyrhynchus]|uniref:Uncharacterized protein n=1 Tax=Rangifer tarandus platyrhynchus TaxID=3082113 RepID=A0ABN8YLH3_RANTA|nr:unnamed protein product [Rangifer tarandus platyrhynchus]